MEKNTRGPVIRRRLPLRRHLHRSERTVPSCRFAARVGTAVEHRGKQRRFDFQLSIVTEGHVKIGLPNVLSNV